MEDSKGNIIVNRHVQKIWENYITELFDHPNWSEKLEVEPEKEADADKKGPCILWSEVENPTKEVRDKKNTADDYVPGYVLKLLGEHGLRIATQLINNIHETVESLKDFTVVTMTALNRKPKATKCSDHHTLSLCIHTAKIVARILTRRIEKKI